MEVVHPRLLWNGRPSGESRGVAIKENGKSEKHKLRCRTTTAELLRLADWLHSHQDSRIPVDTCPHLECSGREDRP